MPVTPPSGLSSTSNNQPSLKMDNQIRNNSAICVAGPNIQPVSIGGSVNRTTTPASSGGPFYQTSAGQIQPNQIQSLNLMVTRFPSDSNRPSAVILQPRAMSAASRGGVVVTSSVAGRTVPINTHQIPIRLAASGQRGVITQSGSGSTIQVMNLSVSNPAGGSGQSSQNAMKQIITPGQQTHQLMDLNLLMTGDRSVRLPEGIINVKPTPGATISNFPHNAITKIRTSNAHTKVINLAGTPVSVSTSNNAMLGTRVGIISHQLPGGGSVNSGSKSVINLATLGQKPAVILNPQSNLVNNSGTVHNVVGASFVTNAQNKQVIPVNQAIMALAPSTQNSRHILHTSSANSASVQITNIQQRTIQNASTLSTVLQNQQTNALGSVASPMKAGVVPASPIKQQQQLQQTTPSSPRPSILIRKRIQNDGQASQVAANLFKASTPTKVQSVSNESVVIKTEFVDHEASEQVNVQTVVVNSTPVKPIIAEGATPRKKPRKQLLEPFNLSTQNVKLISSSDDSYRERDDERESDDASRDDIDIPQTTISKKPRPSLLGNCHTVQKSSLQHHFLRYSDVKPKAEKKQTLSELSNEGIQKKNGWKIHHLATQMEDMSDNESEIYERLAKVLDTFESKARACRENGMGDSKLNCILEKADPTPGQTTFADKMTDLIRGNLQRSNLFQEQITESKTLLIKLTHEHRERVGKLTKKCANKRTFITK